ncbi:TPA: ParB N-terminal domain-containing protein [Salmonella enterica subsp. enterica serovar Bredeney]
MLHLNYDITNLRGAEYNPRFIGDDDLSRLAESVAELGLVKPLIVRGAGGRTPKDKGASPFRDYPRRGVYVAL